MGQILPCQLFQFFLEVKNIVDVVVFGSSSTAWPPEYVLAILRVAATWMRKSGGAGMDSRAQCFVTGFVRQNCFSRSSGRAILFLQASGEFIVMQRVPIVHGFAVVIVEVSAVGRLFGLLGAQCRRAQKREWKTR